MTTCKHCGPGIGHNGDGTARPLRPVPKPPGEPVSHCVCPFPRTLCPRCEHDCYACVSAELATGSALPLPGPPDDMAWQWAKVALDAARAERDDARRDLAEARTALASMTAHAKRLEELSFDARAALAAMTTRERDEARARLAVTVGALERIADACDDNTTEYGTIADIARAALAPTGAPPAKEPT